MILVHIVIGFMHNLLVLGSFYFYFLIKQSTVFKFWKPGNRESLRVYLLVSLLHILQIPEVKLFLSVEFYKIAVDVLLLRRPILSFSVFLLFCLCLFPCCWDLARWSPFWSRSKFKQKSWWVYLKHFIVEGTTFKEEREEKQ